jgi:hypothetical protein
MLLKTLRVKNSRGSVLELPLSDISEGLIVKGIEGLDPVKATLVSSSFANMDGEQYHSSRREARNIKLELALEPDYAVTSVKNLRDQLYKFFMPKTKVLLIFEMFDHHNVSVLGFNLEIEGVIESFENTLFTKNPEVTISLMCFNPDFVDPRLVIFEASSVADLTELDLLYRGTIETGVIFKLRPQWGVNDFAIYHRPPDQTLRIVHFSYKLMPNDVLEISSIKRAKKVTLIRDGVESSILHALSPQSNWLDLYPGNNKLRVYADGPSIPYSIEYTNKHGGL